MSIVPFTFPETGQRVRTVTIDGEPWWIAADVCAVLDIANVGNALGRLDDADKDSIRIADGNRGNPNRAIVSESGLYDLILDSRKPEAKAFRRWITAEVIPAIRRTGGYQAVPTAAAAVMPSHAEALRGWAAELEAREVAERRVAELEPEAARAHQTLDADGLALVGTVAKRFGIREKALREFLYAEGLLIRSGARRNEPMARYVASGHFELKTRLIETDPDRPAQSRSTTYVTPRGEALIWRRLHAAGYVASPTAPARQLAILA